MNKNFSIGLLVVVTALGCGTSEEQAAPVEATEESTPSAPAEEIGTSEQGLNYAPACIYRSAKHEWGWSTRPLVTVTLKNNCGKYMRVKVVIDNGFDSVCYFLSPGKAQTFQSYGWYDYTITC